MILKKALILTITGFSLLLLPAGQVKAQPEDKVVICHVASATPQTMEVPQSAVEGHLGHGDTLGECPVPPVVPEFGLVTGVLALAASAGSFIILKRRKQV